MSLNKENKAKQPDLMQCDKMIIKHRLSGQVDRVFANGPGDLDSIPGRVIRKTLKIVLDASLLNIQQYKVHIKDKVEQSRERSSALPYTSVQQLLKKEPSGRPRLRSPTLLLLSTDFFNRCCSAWIPQVKIILSRYDVII